MPPQTLGSRYLTAWLLRDLIWNNYANAKNEAKDSDTVPHLRQQDSEQYLHLFFGQRFLSIKTLTLYFRSSGPKNDKYLHSEQGQVTKLTS